MLPGVDSASGVETTGAEVVSGVEIGAIPVSVALSVGRAESV